MNREAWELRRRNGRTRRLAAIVVLGATFVLFSSLQAQELLQAPRVDSSLAHAESLSHAFRSAAHTMLPTVVKIESTVKERRSIRRGAPSVDERFASDPTEGMFRVAVSCRFEQRRPRQEGMGSGVIIRADGLVLTNNHVVSGADVLKVQLSDGRVFTAEDVRTDPETDIAILRIKLPDEIPHASLGDSDALDIGDWGWGVGNAFWLEASVRGGIMSGKGRSIDAA